VDKKKKRKYSLKGAADHDRKVSSNGGRSSVELKCRKTLQSNNKKRHGGEKDVIPEEQRTG